MNGGPGDDKLISRDQTADILNCGPGQDTAEIGGGDRHISCEHIIKPRTRRRR